MEDALMHELTAAYALDALEPDQARSYEDHLGRCAPCREELATFAQLTEALAHAAPPATPPAALRRRVLAATRTERESRERRRPRWAIPSLALALAASAAAIALGVSTATHPARIRLNAVPLRGAAGSLIVSDDHSAVLVVSGLPRAPAHHTYEIWVMKSKRAALPAGLFVGGAGTMRLPLERRVPDGSFIGVTLERTGGAARPSEPPIFVSAPA